MSKLDVNKSSGTDNIGPKLLKLSAPIIASPLTYIFNRMIDTGTFPKEFKNAMVTPIYKSGNRTFPTNYRPISVLPTISKLIESHVHTPLISINIFQNLICYILPNQVSDLVTHAKQHLLTLLINL